jgi:gentisate 1,2-dioxygenase
MRRSLCIIAAVGMAVAALPAASQSPPSGLHAREGFVGTLSVLNKGASESVAVNYRTWFIPEGAKVEDVAGTGNLVVEVASGVVTAVIDGQKQRKQFGEFFVVPAGHKLEIITTNRSAILHALQLGK